MSKYGDSEISGVQKAAILLIALGPEKSSQIFKHLKEEEIEELTLEIANTKSITTQTKDEVIKEFYEICLAQQYIAEGGIGYAKELLENALGTDKAMEVIGRLTASLQVKPFEFVRKADASQLLNFIQDEHPQTIALILSYLSPSQAALIISALPPDSQAEVARRIAVMDRTSPDVIKEVEKVLESKLASLVNQDYTIIGGVDAVVDILNTVDRGTEKHIMETLEIEEPELADEIRKKMFVFEDILLLDDKAIQRVLRDVDNNDLAVALKGANEQVQNAIFNNLSKRLVVMIKEVEKVLESKLASLVNQDYTIIGGVDAVVDILNTVDRGTEKHIMETLEIEEPELADEIRKKMFVFEDVLLLDDKAIQRVLRDVDNNDLAVALKGANEQVQNAIFNNLSKRLVVMIKEDMEFMGPVRMKDVEEAQQKIVNIIRKLEDSGEIIISRGGGDEIVV